MAGQLWYKKPFSSIKSNMMVLLIAVSFPERYLWRLSEIKLTFSFGIYGTKLFS
jgi:hypothetical protein